MEVEVGIVGHFPQTKGHHHMGEMYTSNIHQAAWPSIYSHRPHRESETAHIDIHTLYSSVTSLPVNVFFLPGAVFLREGKRERETEIVCVVCVCVRERERDCVCVFVSERDRETSVAVVLVSVRCSRKKTIQPCLSLLREETWKIY